MRASKSVLLLMAAAVVVIGGGGWYFLHWANRGDDSLHVSGNIETVEVAISFKIPGRVDKRYVDEGEDVNEGKPVACNWRRPICGPMRRWPAPSYRRQRLPWPRCWLARERTKSPLPTQPCRRPKPITPS